MKQPECLHIPTLYEGNNAQISWGKMETDTNYIVERIFNESFSQALAGYSWDNIGTSEESWNQYDQDALNWNQIEARTGKGRNWERLDYEELSWSQIEDNSQTWKQLEIQDISFEIFRGAGTERIGIEQGCIWLELDELSETWDSLEMTGLSWEEGELVALPGLSWESIDARWLTFDEWEAKGLTFHELDKQKHVEEHRGMTDSVPIGATNAMYRIKAYDSGGNESVYLITSQLPVIPLFYRNSIMKYPVKAGKCYLILVKAEDASGLDKVRMNLRYDPYQLQLINFAADSLKSITKPGTYSEEQLKIYSCIPGNVCFQSTKPLGQNECFSGAVTLAEFIAKETGTATVSLS